MSVTRTRPRFIAALALLLVMAVLWSSCGDDDSLNATSTPRAGASSVASTTAERAAFKVGIVQSLTGAGAVYGKTVIEGMKLAIDEVNASSDLDVDLVPIVIDDKSTPAGAADAVKQLVSDQAGAILGPTLSGAAPDAHKLAQDASIPVLASTTTGPGITDVGDYIFRIALAEAVVVPSVIEHVSKDTQLKQAVLIIDSTDAFSKLSAAAMRTGMANVNGKVSVEIDLAQTDLATALAGLKGQSVDAFLITPLVEKSGPAAAAVRAAGFTQPIIGGNSFNTLDVARLAGPAAIEGAYVGAAWNPGVDSKASQAFVAAYTKKYGRAPDLFAAQGYATIEVLADGLRRAKSTDHAKLRTALAATANLETPLGKLSISKTREAVHPSVLQRYKGSQLTVVK